MKTLSWLVLRVVFAGYILYAFVMNLSYWSWTVEHTAILTGPGPAKAFALGGLVIMAVGGLSILLGAYGRLGAVLLFAFISLGTIVHFRERDLSVELRGRVVAGLPAAETSPTTVAALDELAGSAYAGHHSSGLKNLVLLAVCLLFACHGTGRLSVVRSAESGPRDGAAPRARREARPTSRE